MDPSSALAVAATVVQFVDFIGPLVSGTYEIYKSASGHTQRNDDLDRIASSLQVIIDHMRVSLSNINQRGQQTSSLDDEIRSYAMIAPW
jgi:hypothetical protein